MTDAAASGCLDAVEMAAFVDGRLEGSERDRVLAHVSTCADCREWLSETVATMDEVATVPRAPRPVFRRVTWAAAIAASVLLAVVAVKRPGGPVVSSFDHLTEPLRDNPQAVAATLWGDSVVRGGGVKGDLRRQSFGLGVLDVDLRVAIAAGDAPQARVRLEVAAERVGQLGFMEEEREFLRQSAQKAVAKPGALTEVGRALRDHEATLAERLDVDFHGLGRWAEAGRLAALHRRDGFFADAANAPAALGIQQRVSDLPPDVRDALVQVQARWPTTALVPEEGRALAAAFQSLIERLQP